MPDTKDPVYIPFIEPHPVVTYPVLKLSDEYRCKIYDLCEARNLAHLKKHMNCPRRGDAATTTRDRDTGKYSDRCLGWKCRGNRPLDAAIPRIEHAVTMAAAAEARAAVTKTIPPSKLARYLDEQPIPAYVKTLAALKKHHREEKKRLVQLERADRGRPKGQTGVTRAARRAALARKLRDIFTQIGLPTYNADSEEFKILCDLVSVTYPEAKESEIAAALKKP